MVSRLSSRHVMMFVLKAAGLFCSFLLICPFVQAANGLLVPQPADILWLQLFACEAVGFLGAGLSLLLRGPMKKHPVFCRITQILLCPLGGALSFWLTPALLPLFERVIGAALGIFVYFMGILFGARPYDRILSHSLLFRFTVIQVAVIALLAWQDKPIELSVSIYIALFVVFNYFVICNQSNLEALMERGSHGLEYLPRRIRSFNLSLVIGLYVFLAALFLFRREIGLFLTWLGNVLFQAVAALFQFLSQLFSGGEKEPVSPVAESVENNIQFIPQNDYSDLINAILRICFAALFVWLIWYYRRQIWEGLRQIFEVLSEHIYRIFHPTAEKREKERESVDYFDEIITLPREKNSSYRYEERSLRRWRAAYRRYKKMKDGAEKYREGYRLILVWLALQKNPQEKSRTPREIFSATNGQITVPSYREATGGYEDLRYGEESVCEEKIQALSETLQRLAE